MPDVAARRFGSGRWHITSVPEKSLIQAEYWGAPCVLLAPPIVANCGAILRGRIVAADAGVRVNCRPCSFASANG